jgi:hypothetical protein
MSHIIYSLDDHEAEKCYPFCNETGTSRGKQGEAPEVHESEV